MGACCGASIQAQRADALRELAVVQAPQRAPVEQQVVQRQVDRRRRRLAALRRACQAWA